MQLLGSACGGTATVKYLSNSHGYRNLRWVVVRMMMEEEEEALLAGLSVFGNVRMQMLPGTVFCFLLLANLLLNLI